MEISDTDRRRMNSKVLQLWRFVVLNLKILKGVDVASGPEARRRRPGAAAPAPPLAAPHGEPTRAALGC